MRKDKFREDLVPNEIEKPLFIKVEPTYLDGFEKTLDDIVLALTGENPGAVNPLVIEAKTRLKLLRDLQEMEDSCVWQGQKKIMSVSMEATIKIRDYENIKAAVVATDDETARIGLCRALSKLGTNATPLIQDHIQEFITEILA